MAFFKKFEKIVASSNEYKAIIYEQKNILKIDNDIDCLGDDFTMNKNKKI